MAKAAAAAPVEWESANAEVEVGLAGGSLSFVSAGQPDAAAQVK